ncbi:MAG: hypothetical protein LBQ55_04030 [Treponema sp.]|nr:hypothetical protein [Treponema sp.]
MVIIILAAGKPAKEFFMKNVYKLPGIIAVAAIIGIALAGCDNGSTTTTGNPVIGRLTITNLPAGMKTYTGVIRVCSLASVDWNYQNGNATIADSATWNAYEVGAPAAGYNGIQDGDNYFEIRKSGTPGSPGYNPNFNYSGICSVSFGLINENLQSDNYKFYGVNNVPFINGKATLNYASFSFTLPATEGEFKLTGADAYNDQYAIVFGAVSGKALYGFDGAVSVTALRGFKIEGGTAQIPIRSLTAGDTYFQSYSGTESVTALVVVIMNTEDFDYTHYTANHMSYHGVTYTNVLFTSGKAEKTVAEGTSF